MISEKQLSRLIQQHIDCIQQEDAAKLLQQQTETFWLLQFQFLSMDKDSECAFNMLYGIRYSDLYKKNRYTHRIDKTLHTLRWKMDTWTEEQFECLCTHFALQLAGVEE